MFEGMLEGIPVENFPKFMKGNPHTSNSEHILYNINKYLKVKNPKCIVVKLQNHKNREVLGCNHKGGGVSRDAVSPTALCAALVFKGFSFISYTSH